MQAQFDGRRRSGACTRGPEMPRRWPPISVPSAGQIGAWKTRAAELAKIKARPLPNALPNMRATMPCSRHGWTPFAPRSTLPTIEAAATIRRARDEAWATHRAALTGDTADEFALALARDDSAGAGRLAKASDLADIRATMRSLAEAAAGLSRMRQQQRSDRPGRRRTIVGNPRGGERFARRRRRIHRPRD